MKYHPNDGKFIRWLQLWAVKSKHKRSTLVLSLSSSDMLLSLFRYHCQFSTLHRIHTRCNDGSTTNTALTNSPIPPNSIAHHSLCVCVCVFSFFFLLTFCSAAWESQTFNIQRTKDFEVKNACYFSQTTTHNDMLYHLKISNISANVSLFEMFISILHVGNGLIFIYLLYIVWFVCFFVRAEQLVMDLCKCFRLHYVFDSSKYCDKFH